MLFCRLEHHRPTSHEVGMQNSVGNALLQAGASSTHLLRGGYAKQRGQCSSVGWSIIDPPLTRWVCKTAWAMLFCRLEHHRPTSYEVGMQNSVGNALL